MTHPLRHQIQNNWLQWTGPESPVAILQQPHISMRRHRTSLSLNFGLKQWTDPTFLSACISLCHIFKRSGTTLACRWRQNWTKWAAVTVSSPEEKTKKSIGRSRHCSSWENCIGMENQAAEAEERGLCTDIASLLNFLGMLQSRNLSRTTRIEIISSQAVALRTVAVASKVPLPISKYA